MTTGSDDRYTHPVFVKFRIKSSQANRLSIDITPATVSARKATDPCLDSSIRRNRARQHLSTTINECDKGNMNSTSCRIECGIEPRRSTMINSW